MVNYDEYYENSSKPQKRILDVLKGLDYEIDASELSNLSEVNPKNLSKVVNPLVNDGIVICKEVSPKGKKVRFKYFSLADKKDLKQIDISEVKTQNKTSKIPQKVKIVKQKIDTKELSENLKQEILDELKTSLMNNTDILKAKSELIKMIMKLPIREVDKKEFGLSNISAYGVRKYFIDLLDIITLFKE